MLVSADRITQCPSCGEGSLREWMGYGLADVGGLIELEIDYEAKCPECGYGFAWKGNVAPDSTVKFRH